MNQKFCQQLADDVMALVSKGVVRPTAIARTVGVTYQTFSGWLLKSSRNDPAYLITFHDEPNVQFARAFALSKRLAFLELRGLVEQTSIFGREETLYMNGQVVWALDPKAAAIADEDVREMLGYRRDALLEIDGALQPVKAHRDAPFAMQIRVLEAAFKDLRPSSVSEVNVNGNVAIGVKHIAKPTYDAPPVIPPPPVRPELEVIDVDVEDGPDADDLHDDDAEQIAPPTPPIQIVIAPVLGDSAEPEQVAQPEPQSVREGRPLSALQSDLLKRLRSADPAERSKPL